MDKKRIAFFQEDLGPGGIQKSLFNLLRNLDYDRVDAELFLFEEGCFFEGELPAALTVRVQPPPPRPYSFMPFETARKLGKSLTSISKGNALNYSMVFWDQVFREIAAEYPDVETHTLLVDAASMFMVLHPERFGVVVCSNLFGDILTDLGAAISGGMGLAAGANLNPEGRFPSMFEPIHGSAPDIAGKNISNPLATFWSVSQMLDHFGLAGDAAKVLSAIEDVLTDGRVLTPDLGGTAHTSDVGDAVIAAYKARL